MTRHHEEKAKHMGGQVDEISIETRVYADTLLGLGVSDIAIRRFGRDDDDTRAEVRGLIAAGRKKALGAH